MFPLEEGLRGTVVPCSNSSPRSGRSGSENRVTHSEQRRARDVDCPHAPPDHMCVGKLPARAHEQREFRIAQDPTEQMRVCHLSPSPPWLFSDCAIPTPTRTTHL